uniref:Putative secreted protein n=1 Tax=Ixodes ricinus TaxID=34613 RepID=A0A6B0TZQ3_IXORI
MHSFPLLFRFTAFHNSSFAHGASPCAVMSTSCAASCVKSFAIVFVVFFAPGTALPTCRGASAACTAAPVAMATGAPTARTCCAPSLR